MSKSLSESLRANADVLENALNFMGDEEMKQESEADIALWREAADDIDRLCEFAEAVHPFVRDVLDKPFPWEAGGQVITWMQREQYERASAALSALDRGQGVDTAGSLQNG